MTGGAGWIEPTGGAQLGQQQRVQPVQTPAACQSRSRRQQVIPEPWILLDPTLSSFRQEL